MLSHQNSILCHHFKVIHKIRFGSSLTRRAHYPVAEAILRGHCRDYNNNRVYVSSTAWAVGRRERQCCMADRHSPLDGDEARLAGRSGAKQFTKTLCFWRVVGGLAVTACDPTDLSKEGGLSRVKILSMFRSTFNPKVL